MSYFTPEKEDPEDPEDPSSRFRESTPKTPLFRKKGNTYTPEIEDDKYRRMKEYTPKTPQIANDDEKEDEELTPSQFNFKKYFLKIRRIKKMADKHINGAILEQKRVVEVFKTAIDYGKQFKKDTEELEKLLEIEEEKYEILKSIIEKKPIRSQIIVPYGLF